MFTVGRCRCHTCAAEALVTGVFLVNGSLEGADGVERPLHARASWIGGIRVRDDLTLPVAHLAVFDQGGQRGALGLGAFGWHAQVSSQDIAETTCAGSPGVISLTARLGSFELSTVAHFARRRAASVSFRSSGLIFEFFWSEESLLVDLKLKEDFERPRVWP